MNIKELIANLIMNLPKYMDRFTDFIGCATPDGEVLDERRIKVNTDEDSGLEVGRKIYIKNLKIKNNVLEGTIENKQLFLTMVDEHDFTHIENQTVELGGFGNADLNEVFEIAYVIDRKRIVLNIPEGITTTGSLGHIWESRDFGGKGVVEVIEVEDDYFIYEINGKDPDLPVTDNNSVKDIEVVVGVRVNGSPDPERAMKIYTETEEGKEEGERRAWAFVMFPDETASKDPYTVSDAQASFSVGEECRQRIMINFDVLVILPTTDLGAVNEVQECCGEIRDSLIKSLVGLRISDARNDVDFKTVYVGSTMNQYNTSTYIRMYSFQTSFDITFNESFDNYPLTVALREATMEMIHKGEKETEKIKAQVEY